MQSYQEQHQHPEAPSPVSSSQQLDGAKPPHRPTHEETPTEPEGLVERERYPHRRIVHRAQVLAIAYVIALAVVILLAFAAHSMRVLPGDVPFTLEVQELPNPVVDGVPVVFDLMYGVSIFGYSVASTIILVGVVLIFWLLNMRLEAIFVVLTVPADVIGAIIKLVVGRPRPSPDLVHVVDRLNSYSFPSGHTLHYTVFYGFILFVLAINFRSSPGRNLLMVICALLIALVGLSRVYLGEHWASDVVGGYLIGALYLVPLIWAYTWARARFVTHSSSRSQRSRAKRDKRHQPPTNQSPTESEAPGQSVFSTPNH